MLASRGQELQEIDESLRGVALGRPTHIALFGPQGVGKTSLLSGLAHIAAQRNLLPVTVDVREATVESELTFYATVIEAALDSLIGLGALKESDPFMEAWSRQTTTGEVAIPREAQPLEIGLMLAARSNGKIGGPIPPSLIARDLQRIIDFGKEHQIRGIVLCFDSAKYLDDNRDLAPSLLEVAQKLPHLSLVTVGEEAGTLQAAAPRAWAQLEVGPFNGPNGRSGVYEAMTLPLADVEERGLVPAPETAAEIYSLTGGQPYEVNLVCHFIWDAVQRGEQDSFELSQVVIERVLAELGEKGRYEASPTIEAISDLGTADYEALSRVAPFENMTLRQMALARLIPADYDDARRDEVEADVSEDLTTLEEKGILERERDRFALSGGQDARLYLKYAVQGSTGKRIHYRDSYVRLGTNAVRTLVGPALFGEAYGEGYVAGGRRPHEVGGVIAGRWMTDMAEAVRQNDVGTVASMLPGNYEDKILTELTEKGAVFVGVLLRIGVHDVESAELIINTHDLDEADLLRQAEEWRENNADLLAKYDIAVRELRIEVVTPDLALGMAVKAQLDLWCHLATAMYLGGFYEGAGEMLGDCIDRAEALLGATPSDPIVRSALADALNRRGFIHATRGNWSDALRDFSRSRAQAVERQWFVEFNTAYVQARMGEMEQAANLATSVSDAVGAHDNLILLAAFPYADEWESPNARAHVVELQGAWLKRFVDLQGIVFAAQADSSRLAELGEILDELTQSAPPAVLRLGAWAELTLLKRPERAVALFEFAVEASRFDRVETVRDELQFANEWAESGRPMGDASDGDSPTSPASAASA